MKTRLIRTSLYRDSKFRHLDFEDKFLVIFLLTNEFLECIPVIEIDLEVLAFHCSIDPSKLEKRIEEFSYFQIFYKNGYLITGNKFSYTDFLGGKTKNKRINLITELPAEIQDIITQSLPNDCPIVGDIKHKTENINHKQENIKHKTEDIHESVRKKLFERGLIKTI